MGYDPNEPRDEQGQWTDGGLSSVSWQEASEKDKRALGPYFENKYGLKLNAFLRGQPVDGDLAKIKGDANNLVSAYNRNAKPIEGDMVSFRGIHGNGAAAFRAMKAGDEFTDKGMVSTSLDKDWAKTFAAKAGAGGMLIEVHASKGTKMLGGNRGSKEKEAVFGPGSKFRVKSASKSQMVIEII